MPLRLSPLPRNHHCSTVCAEAKVEKEDSQETLQWIVFRSYFRKKMRKCVVQLLHHSNGMFSGPLHNHGLAEVDKLTIIDTFQLSTFMMLLSNNFATTHTGGSKPILPNPATAPRAIVECDIVTRINANPLRSREDMIDMLLDLLLPLKSGQSEGGARVVLGHSGAGFDPVAAELEGYARALWGLGPLLASEPEHPRFRSMKWAWVKGLANGTNPNHEEYWGDCGNRDQRLVEQAAIVSHST